MAVSTPPDLWKTAIDSVDLQVKDRLAPTKTLVRDIVDEVLKEAKARHNDSVKQRLRLPNGIIVRDLMEKIMHWVNCFKEVGDNAVQFDPGHAALPWAAVRFILQALINYGEVEREILEEIELVARLLAIFRGIEKSYLGPDAMVELQDAIVRTYIAILETLANAVKLLGESKKAKLLKAPFRVPDRKNISRLLAQEREVFSFTRLVDGDRVSQMMTKLERLTERSTITDIAVENEKHKAVLDWLSKTNYRDHHRDRSGIRLVGTGDWLLQHAEYISWQQRSSCSTLVIHGIPGCGKTILCSTVIDELMQSAPLTQITPLTQNASSTQSASSTQVKAPVAFFYCSAVASEPDRRDFTKILRSLLRQLTNESSHTQRTHSAVLAAYDARLEEAKKDGFDIRSLGAVECETMILDILEDNPATFVIDAIDEIDEPQELLHSLQTICSKSKNILKVLVSSRDNPLILSTLSAAHQIRVTTKDNHSDVHRFITQRVDKLIERRKMPQGVRNETILILSTRAGEMFQWAKLQLAQLEYSQDPLIEKDFQKRLSELATSTLEGLYGSIFGDIMQYKDTARQMATHTFSWLLFACEPLRVNVLLAATANAAGWETPTPEGFLEICRGFVYIDTQSNLVRLVHESVREFLLSQPLLQPHLGQTLISLTCLQILENPPQDDVKHLKPADEPYDYATLYCGQHFSQAGSTSVSDTLSQNVETFLFDGDEVSIYADIWLTTVKTICDALPHDHSQKVPMGVVVSESCSPIFPISVFGLLFLLEAHHWPPGFDWNQRNSQKHTSLYLAANFGHDAVVSFLLDRNADPNIKCGIFGNALQCAAYRGHGHVVEILVNRGADLKLPGKFESVLHAACSGGHEEVALKLLESRLEFTTQSEYDIAAAEVAKAGFARALDKLQAHPLSNTLTSDRIQQQARAAIVSGKLAVLKHLISRSTFALVIVKGSLALTAVHGHEAIAEFLMANGVDIDEHGHLGTPLRCASACGHNNICRLLLDHGADVNTNARFGTALHAAAMRGHLHTAKFLLDKGANVNAQGGHYGTPMQAAAYHGHVELVNLFLDAKADTMIPGLFRNAFYAAIEGGREDVVRIFADAGLPGLTANGKDLGIWRPLAMECCSERPQQNILRDSSPSRCADDNAAEKRQPSSLGDSDDGEDIELDPFDRAHAPCSHKSRRGRRRSDPGYTKQHMLETAAAFGNLAIVRVLLSGSCVPGGITVAFIAACRYGHPDVVRDLLDSVSLSSDCMRDAFAAVSNCHDDEVTQILIGALDRLEGQEKVQLLQKLLLESVPDNTFLFGRVLRKVVDDGSEHYAESLLTKCLKVVAMAGWLECLHLILENLPQPKTDDILDALNAAFDADHATTVSTLLKYLTEVDITAPLYNGLVSSAAEDGHTEVLECFLPRTNFSHDKKSFEYMIRCAAGSGRLRILTTLTSQEWACFYNKTALRRALFVAARHGHYDVCSYLVSKDAAMFRSVVKSTGKIVIEAEVTVHQYPVHRNESPSTGHSLRDLKRNARRYRPFSRSSGDADKAETDLASEKWCNLIEACLAGYRRFSRDDVKSFSHWTRWKLAEKSEHAKTLIMLFDQCPDFQGPQWVHIICEVSAICPPGILNLLLVKGADPFAATEKTSALICAAGRSTSTFAAVQALLSASDTAFRNIELRQALDASILLFGTGSPGSTLFPMYETIEEIFVSGPGAFVNYLLQRLPHETVTGDGYSVCFQMAAATGNHEVVHLLLERGVDCNAVVGYYGTALKAACRLGHSAIVTLLLESGADHTIAAGEASYTALQAAVMARSLPSVQSLLDYGADANLSTSMRGSHGPIPNATALRLAVDARLTSISVLLIDAGARVEVEGDHEQPLLIKACSWGQTSVVQSLLDAGADVRVSGTRKSSTREVPKQYGSPLHAVVAFGHFHLVELLIAHGLKITASCGTTGHPLEYAASKADVSGVTTLLKLCTRDYGTPFVEAAKSALSHSRHDVARLICEHARGVLTARDILFLCRHPNSTAQCSTIWYFLERLRQLNGSAGEFAEALRHFMRHAQPATALQLFTHAEMFLSSREIWGILEQACLRSSRQFVVLLIETLQGRQDFDLDLETASTEIIGIRPEHLYTLLSYVPCTLAMFEKACITGDEQIVRIGLNRGLASGDVDVMQRPVLHLAAAHGHTVVVNMLLKELIQPRSIHEEFGTPIEAVLMSCAVDFSFIEKPMREKKVYLRDLTSGFGRKFYQVHSTANPQRAAACKNIIRLLLEHESHQSPSEGASGSTFLELSLAAYLGWRDVLRQLLMQDVPILSHRSVLISPLIAAINSEGDDSLGMVVEILKFDKSLPGVSFYDPEGHALHHACQCAELPIVKALLSHGYSFAYKNGEGQSALTVCLEIIAGSLYVPRDTHLVIAHTLLERDAVASVSAEDIVAACGTAVGREQNAIFQTLFARWEPFYIPEEGIIRLLSAEEPKYDILDEDILWQRVFEERRIEKMTANLFAGVDRVDVLTKLLDYDPSFVVGTDTIDLVGTRSRCTGRQSILDCVEKLLNRCLHVLPTETNVLRVLSIDASCDASHILKLLFIRNPSLMVTEQMLKICRNPANLDSLLSLEKTGDHQLIMSLLDALLEDSKDLATWNRSGPSARLAVLLDHVPCAKLPRKVIEYIMESTDLGNIGRILDRDPDTSLTGDVLSAIIKAPGTVARHGDVVDFLRKHRGRYSTSDFKTAVGSIHMYSKAEETQIKKLYNGLHE